MSMSLARLPGTNTLRADRVTARQIESARASGAQAAARIEAASFATHVALHHAGMLSASEGQLIERVPLGEARYRAIVDTFAATACAELSALTFR